MNPDHFQNETLLIMFTIARVEAFVRVRCVWCDYGFALVGDPADKIIYRFLFNNLKFGNNISAICPSCSYEFAVLEAADYVMPQLWDAHASTILIVLLFVAGFFTALIIAVLVHSRRISREWRKNYEAKRADFNRISARVRERLEKES